MRPTLSPILAAVAALLVAGCSAPTSAARPTSSPAASRPAVSPSGSAQRALAVVGVTADLNLAVLDPTTGAVQRTLPPVAVNGDEVAVTPDGRTIYYELRTGCDDMIETVSVTGGASSMVDEGTLPALSPDGSELAFVKQPATKYRQLPQACFPAGSNPAASDQVVVRNLRTGHETVYPLAPDLAKLGLPYPVSHVSWAPDGVRLAVSIEAPEDNVGWALVILDTRTDRYYYTTAGTGMPVTSGPNPSRSYYREGVFMPDGNLFVNRVCCSGIQPGAPATTSSLLWEVTPAGTLVHQVAIGFTNRDHTSLDADSSGRWLLYLSDSDLYVSRDGQTPVRVASSLTAATWAELPVSAT